MLSTGDWNSPHHGAYLGNGHLGQRVLQAGGLYVNGAEPVYLAGHYERDALKALPPVTPLQVRIEDQIFGADPKQLRAYHQELRLKEGILVTRATWDTGDGPVELEVETLIARQVPDLALLRLSVKNGSSKPLSAGVPDAALPANGPEGLDYAVGTFLAPLGKKAFHVSLAAMEGPEETAPSNPFTMPIDGFRTRIQVPAGQSARIVLATHVVDYPVKPRPSASPLWSRLEGPAVEAVVAGHTAAWRRLWVGDIEVTGDPEAQEALRVCRYQLLAGVRAGSAAGVPPMGQSTAAFNGHVFWDMDSWMLPALLPQNPELARSMLEYRFGTLSGARQNARTEGLPGASYAWESAGTGVETLHGGEFRHGRHVTGDVALALRQYHQATGDAAWLKERAWPILRETAANWASRAKKDESGFSFTGVTTPDELAGRVDHSAWTNFVARENLRFATETAKAVGQVPDPRWKSVADGIAFRRHPESKLILAYASWKDTSKAKQADTLLMLHPGGMKVRDEEAGRLYDYYAPRVIKNGPAMTDAIHAVIAARLGRGDEALSRFRESYRPFVRPPYHAYSEKRSRENLNFLTGCGGVLQAALYGFAGLRLEPDPAAPGKPRLEPHLPPGWTGMRINDLHWRGKRWNVEITPGQLPRWAPA